MHSIGYAGKKSRYDVKLLKKAKWHSEYENRYTSKHSNWVIVQAIRVENYLAGLDFDPTGEFAASLDCYGAFVISDMDTNTNNHSLHLKIKTNGSSGNP